MRALLWFTAGLFLPSFLLAQEQSANVQLNPVPPLLATTRSFAEKHKIEINGICKSRAGGTEIGDASTLLISLQDKKHLEQYLVTLEVVALSDQDRASKSADTRVYLSTGNHFVYHYLPVALQIATYGPFAQKSGTAPADPAKTARVLVSAENLALGFDNSSRAFLRIRDYKRAHNDRSELNIAFRPNPFPADVVEKTKRACEKVGLTDAEEKSLAGTMPAMLSFFSLAQNTPGLRDILNEVIDYPSAWSVIKRGGRVDTNIGFQGAGVQNVGPESDRTERYYLPLELDLNEQKCLDMGIVVAAARPPLLTTAGIERIYARSPSKPERMAFLEVIGAQVAPPHTP